MVDYITCCTYLAFQGWYGQNTNFFERLLHWGLCEHPIEVTKKGSQRFIKKVRKGLMRDFKGIDSAYEDPNNPDIILDTERYNKADCVLKVLIL